MKRRWLAALLALVLCISCFGTPVSAASAVRQEDVEVQLVTLMQQYCGTYFYDNYYGATQCKGFADMISDKLYGKVGGPGPYSDNRYYLPNAASRGYTSLGILSPGACSAENLRALFLKARPGDYVQCVRYTGTQHSLIVADVHTTGVTFFDCNLKGSYLCASYFYNWEEIGSTFTRGCSLYRYSGYVVNDASRLVFDPNGGTCAMSVKTVSPGSAFGVLPTPERQGYSFDGWYMLSFNASRTPEQIPVNSATVKTSLYGTVLFARWVEDGGPCALLGHAWTKSRTVAATCTENGYTVEVCSRCSKVRDTDITSALGHNWKLLASVPASNVDDGEETYQCTRCGSFDLRVILCQLHKFADLSENAWYYPSVREMVSYALMNGTSKTSFSPDQTLTRAMLVTILWRMEGEPSVMPSGFRDVPSGKWYSAAVDWAADVGVITGFPDATFRPDVPVTREQAAVILFRYAPVMGRSNTERARENTFSDGAKVSGYALEAASWAFACGIVTGYPDGTLRPDATASRAQIAKMIVTFLNETVCVERDEVIA